MSWPRGGKRPARLATPNLLLYISAVTLLYLSIKSFLVSRRLAAWLPLRDSCPSVLPLPEGVVGAARARHRRDHPPPPPPGPGQQRSCWGWATRPAWGGVRRRWVGSLGPHCPVADARAAVLAGAPVSPQEAAELGSARGVGESKESGSPESQCWGPASLGLLGWGARPQMLPPLCPTDPPRVRRVSTRFQSCGHC